MVFIIVKLRGFYHITCFIVTRLFVLLFTYSYKVCQVCIRPFLMRTQSITGNTQSADQTSHQQQWRPGPFINWRCQNTLTKNKDMERSVTGIKVRQVITYIILFCQTTQVQWLYYIFMFFFFLQCFNSLKHSEINPFCSCFSVSLWNKGKWTKNKTNKLQLHHLP